MTFFALPAHFRTIILEQILSDLILRNGQK